MVAAALLRFQEGVAGKLLPVGLQIIAAGPLRRDPEAAYRLGDHLQLALHVIIVPVHTKREVQIAQVVVDRTAAAETPGKLSAVSGKRLQIHLFPGILVAPDDHCPLILPKVQKEFIPLYLFCQPLFQGQIHVGICPLGLYEFNPRKHNE